MKFLYLVLWSCVPAMLRAQAVFISTGSIEYERSINVHKQVDKDGEDDAFFKTMMASIDPLLNQPFILYFDSSKVLYQPQGEFQEIKFPWIVGPAKDNTIFTDYSKEFRISGKTIFEQRFLVQDSLCRIHWKIYDETRSIAGLDCRKAVGIICDSVYVTAFYSEEIPISGGPESFGGLPGMILGLAIPRLHTTWFAKKIINRAPPANTFIIPTKGKKIDRTGLATEIKKSTKDWGKWAQKNVWWTLL